MAVNTGQRTLAGGTVMPTKESRALVYVEPRGNF
jgi:hypothetical protein